MPSKLDPNLDDIRAAIEANVSYIDIAEGYGVHESAIRRFAAKHSLKRPVPVKKVVTFTPPQAEVSREETLAAENAELKRHLKRARSIDVQAERVLQSIETAVKSAPPQFNGSLPSGRVTPHVHNLLLSDLHYGEVVDPEQVNGLNEYNVDVLKRRLESVFQSVLSFKAHRNYEITKLVISVLGDMCSGGPGIHDEIRDSNERTAAEQGHEMGMLLGQFIENLVPHYEVIEVDGVSGNHPRMAKPHASKNVFDSFDWMAYRVAEVYVRGYESVRCNFPRAGMIVKQIAGKNVLLMHGDGIRSTMPGVPWGGVVRRVNELRKQYGAQGVLLDAVQLGHFHDPNVVGGGAIFMNGSLVGVNEYGLKNFGAGAQPTQLLLTWHEGTERLTDVSFITPN